MTKIKTRITQTQLACLGLDDIELRGRRFEEQLTREERDRIDASRREIEADYNAWTR